MRTAAVLTLLFLGFSSFFAEAIRQTSEPANLHSHGQVLPLDIGR